MNKKILAAVLVVVAVAALGGAYYQGFLGGHPNLARLVTKNPALKTEFDTALSKEAALKKTPDDPAAYLSLGLQWKTVAELSPKGTQAPFFAESLAVYEAGIKKFGNKNILFYINGGNVAVAAEQFTKAEGYYRKAIEISPGDDQGYRSLAELYMYHMKKTKDEVVAVYNEGIKKMYNPAVLIWSRGSYLRRVGDYAGALKDYEQLVKNFPSNTGYQEIVAELKAKVQ